MSETLTDEELNEIIAGCRGLPRWFTADTAHKARVSPERVRSAFSELLAARKKLAELEAERDEALGYATRLLESYVRKYCNPVPEWKPLPELVGVLTQLDNASAVTGEILARAEAAEAERDAESFALQTRAEAAEATVERLRAALEPFAKAAADLGDGDKDS